jgi:hypothetical protein
MPAVPINVGSADRDPPGARRSTPYCGCDPTSSCSMSSSPTSTASPSRNAWPRSTAILRPSCWCPAVTRHPTGGGSPPPQRGGSSPRASSRDRPCPPSSPAPASHVDDRGTAEASTVNGVAGAARYGRPARMPSSDAATFRRAARLEPTKLAVACVTNSAERRPAVPMPHEAARTASTAQAPTRVPQLVWTASQGGGRTVPRLQIGLATSGNGGFGTPSVSTGRIQDPA